MASPTQRLQPPSASTNHQSIIYLEPTINWKTRHTTASYSYHASAASAISGSVAGTKLKAQSYFRSCRRPVFRFRLPPCPPTAITTTTTLDLHVLVHVQHVPVRPQLYRCQYMYGRSIRNSSSTRTVGVYMHLDLREVNFEIHCVDLPTDR